MNVVQYKPIPRAAWRPSLRGARTIRMGHTGFDGFGYLGPLTSILGLGFAGLTAYVGIRTGLDQKKISMKVMGWIVGGVGTLGVLFLVGNLLSLASKPRPTITTDPGQVAQNQQQPQGIQAP